jgi:hypothetical protein
MNRRVPPRRLVWTALFVGAASAALASAGPDALLPFKAVAGAATEVSVALVVDFGGSTRPEVGCVKVPASDNGYYALAAFIQQEKEVAPAYAGSGLLCSINGIPSSGCGQQVGGGYIYWSYWHGDTGTWNYAGTGAFAVVGSYPKPDVEGWKFQDPAPDNASDPPPAASPDYASICGSTASMTTSPSMVTVPPTTVPSAQVPAAAGPASTAPSGAGPGPVGTSTPTAPPGGHPVASGKVPSSNPASGAVGALPYRHASPRTSTTAPSAGQHTQVLSASNTADRRGSGGSPAPLIIGGSIVAVLIAGTVYRWRRRPGTP